MKNSFCSDCNNQTSCAKRFSTPTTAIICTMFVPKLSAEKKGVKMRNFESGATRNNVEGRLNYVKALSPIVLERYVQYLNAHREQADGTMRDFDNWKKGIPTDVYLEGLGRHFIAVWQLAQGFPAEDNKGPVTLEDTLCAIIFNASGWLHEIIKEERKDTCGKKKAKTDSALVICNNSENCISRQCVHGKPHKLINYGEHTCCDNRSGCRGICEKVEED